MKKKLSLAALSNIPAYLSDASPERELCASCGLFKKCSTPFMRPRVPEDWSGKLLCVGEGPGQHEDEESGKPFTGPSGKLLRKLYQKAGFADRDVALVNSVRCRVPHNGKPSMAQIRACRPFLLQVIRKLNPVYCLGLGGVSLRALSNNGDANITKGRGKKIIVPGLEKCPLTYVTFHPASVLWGSFENEQRIIEDLQRFTRQVLLPARTGIPVRSTGSLGFDVEYAPDGRLLTIGVADSTSAGAIETTEKGWVKKVKALFKKKKILAGHSIGGDLDYLVKTGLAKVDWLKGFRIRDSFLLARMVDENRGKGGYGLEPLLLSYFNATPWKRETEQLLKKNGDASAWSVEQRTERCRIDAWATKVLSDRLKGEVSGPLATFTHQIALSLHRVGLAGAAIDLQRFHRLGKQWRQKAKQSRDLVVRAALRSRMKEFQPTNDTHIRDYLYVRKEYPVLTKTSRTGLPGVDKLTLKKLLADKSVKRSDTGTSFIRNLLDFNQYDKLASTWYGRENEDGKKHRASVGDLIKPIPKNKRLGLLHFWLFPLRARTGRRASGGNEEGDPQSRNSQNWPPVARKVIVSRWPKGRVAVCDFTRLEVLLMGWRANDEKLLNYFLKGEGYIGVAKEFWGQDVKPDTPLYKATKSLVLGLDYNMGWWKLAHDLWEKANFRFSEDWETHVQKTRQARKKYLAMFPGLRSYIRNRIHEVTTTQQVISPTGRIRHLPHHGPESEGFWHIKNAAVNQPIQSFAADITGSALFDYETNVLKEHGISFLEWHRALIDAPWDLPLSPVFNEVHDELDLDLHPKSGKKDLEILVDAMENVRSLKKLVPDFKLKLKVDVRVGASWE